MLLQYIAVGLTHVCVDLVCGLDLRKFRSYKGSSVRDLLRAMRNKVTMSHGFLLAVQFIT